MLAKDGIKYCPGCKRELPVDSFQAGKAKDGLRLYCKECTKVKNEELRKKRLQERAQKKVLKTFSGKQPREVINEIRERIGWLKSQGYKYEGRLTYLQTIEL